MLPPFLWCFRNRIDDNYEGYAVVSEYFGRGLFNKLTVVADESRDTPDTLPAPPPVAGPTLSAAPPPAITVPPTYGPGAEAKLRLQEGQSKQVYVANTTKQVAPKGTAVIPVPEGRMRLLEQQRYSSSLEANMNKLEPRIHHKQSPLASPKNHQKPTSKEHSLSGSPKISSAISNSSKNPFDDEETYDEAKNPFADDVPTDPTNPFNEEEDYDKNLNPFS